MDSGTKFNLNQAILAWRKNLAKGNAITREELNELEYHLLEQIDRLNGTDLTEEETFFIATHRLGSIAAIREEYTKNRPWYGFIFVLLQAAMGVFLLIYAGGFFHYIPLAIQTELPVMVSFYSPYSVFLLTVAMVIVGLWGLFLSYRRRSFAWLCLFGAFLVGVFLPANAYYLPGLRFPLSYIMQGWIHVVQALILFSSIIFFSKQSTVLQPT